MLGTALIVFREVLEAALVVGILAAATRATPGRAAWLAGGIIVGLLGSILFALGTDAIAELANGIGQELFNAIVLGIAVLMLAWHNVWIVSHGKQLAAQARSVGDAVHDGKLALRVLLGVVALAVLREGTETVLFLYGVTVSGQVGLHAILAGGAMGVASGALVGWLLYAGLLRIPLRWFFTVTATLVLFLAAGMASQAAGFLIQANLVPALIEPLWDTSALLPGDSVLGILLHGLVGYVARPAGTQVLCYVLVLLAIAAGMKWAKPPPHPA
ncbi:MAG: FTR1 family protein [Betaproteobacteria bacterium]|nr:FTR1 family protein [Betaproteobacteria bacterium]